MSRLGATPIGGDGCRFVVWAPRASVVEVHLLGEDDRLVTLARGDDGYHEAVVDAAPPGRRYLYRLDGARERPDPASRLQHDTVHGPSVVVDPGGHRWQSGDWAGLPLERLVFYELHVGAFTPEGTLDAIVPHLDDLRELGVTAVEIMPVAQFPGTRNWGYDGVFPFAVQNSYGGPSAFCRLVDACHARGLAVALDVVYNHLGPEGNYLSEFGPYLTDRYRTPWGEAVNFDGPGSDHVRRYFIENALWWIEDCRVDILRLDAVHAIFDFSARPFLEELADTVRDRAGALGRRVHLVAESSLNDPRIVRPAASGGWGLDAQWNDDLHHALHVNLTGENDGYYSDFAGEGDLAKALADGFVLDGRYSRYRGRRHGRSARHVDPAKFVVFAQNHDQVGNRMRGERLSTIVPFEDLKLAAGCVILSPYLPLLFMGEEYGETAPFPYFVSHGDPSLVEAVRRGRRDEFRAFAWAGEPPDPQGEPTFLAAKLDRGLVGERRHRALLEYHRELLRLRRETPALARATRERLEVDRLDDADAVRVARADGAERAVFWLNFDRRPIPVRAPDTPTGWRVALASSDPRWEGPGPASATEPLAASAALDIPPRSIVLLLERTTTEAHERD